MMAAVLLFACAGGNGEPTYATDELYVEPDGDGIIGFQTWSVYDDSYPDDDAYVCGQVFELTGTQSEDWDCVACEVQFAVTATLMETDCPGGWSTGERLGALTGIGIGTLGPSLSDDDPHPGSSLGGYTDQGSGELEPHGWAYTEAVANGGSGAATWDGSEPWVLEPAWAWDLTAQ